MHMHMDQQGGLAYLLGLARRGSICQQAVKYHGCAGTHTYHAVRTCARVTSGSGYRRVQHAGCEAAGLGAYWAKGRASGPDTCWINPRRRWLGCDVHGPTRVGSGLLTSWFQTYLVRTWVKGSGLQSIET